jgi:hypothetical protein
VLSTLYDGRPVEPATAERPITPAEGWAGRPTEVSDGD